MSMNILKYITSLALLSLSLSVPNLLYAKGEVTHINSHRETAPSTSYTKNSNNYTWQGDNLVIDSFEYNGTTYDYTVKADKVKIRRVDNDVTTDERCALFSEADSEGSNNLKPSYPRLGSTDNCDMAAVMGGNVINRGVLDLFNNGGGGRTFSAKNVERVDFIFTGGVTTPIDVTELSQTGVVVTEKSGNNDVLVAAILSLDENGDPASYGPAVRIYRNWESSSTKYAYGMTNIGYPITFLANDLTPPQNYPYNVGSSWESLGMVFVDVEALGLSTGQTWYGFSYFSPDLGNNAPNAKGQIAWNAGIDPVNYNGFPLNTDHSYDYGDADVYGGVGGYFVKSSLSNIYGTAYKDDNTNSTLDANESGVSNIKVTLYRDDNSNGSLQPSDTELLTVNTDKSGLYSFVGVPNGVYIVVIDKNDPDTPVTHALNGSDTISLTINNADSLNNNYPYIPQNLSTLIINKTVSTPNSIVSSGDQITYTITVTNFGDKAATGVKVMDRLSSDVSYVSDDSGGSYNPTTGLWTLGKINKNKSKTLNITVSVN